MMSKTRSNAIEEILTRMLVRERAVKDIREKFEERGFSWQIVRRVGRKLGVVKRHEGYGDTSVWYWSLAEFSEEEPEPAEEFLSYVYIIQDAGNQCIKIGSAHDTQKRLAELQIGNPNELHILLSSEQSSWGAAMRKEHQVRAALRAWHIRGKWFSSAALNVAKEVLTIQVLHSTGSN